MISEILTHVDFEKANALLEGFSKSTGLVTAILDLEGNILSKSGWRQICTDFHRKNPVTSSNCYVSDTMIGDKTKVKEKYHFYKCMNGLIDVWSPIVIKGEHIGNLFSGQFFFEKPDITFFKKQAKNYGFEELEYLKALEKVPIFTREKIETSMEFLLDIIKMIIEMTSDKIEQIEINDVVRQSATNLRENQVQLNENLKDLLESQRIAHLGTWRLNVATNQVVWSEELYKMYGFDPALPPPPYTEHMKLFTPESWNRLSNSLEFTRIYGVPYELELETVTTDGSNGWMWVRGEAETDSDGNIISLWGAAQDITEYKKIDNERHKFFLLAESSSEFIGMCDLDMKPLYVNPAGRRMVGLTDIDAACRVNVVDYYFPEDQRFIVEEFFPRVLREGHGDVEIRLRHFQTGEPIWMFYSLFSFLDDSGKPIGWATVSHDITQRRLTQESLKTFANRLMILHRIDQAILKAIDSPEEIAQEAILHLRNLLDSKHTSVGIFDFEKKEVLVYAVSGDTDSIIQVGAVFPEEIYGDLNILNENKLEIVENYLRMEKVSTILISAHGGGIQSSINAPIISPKGLVGVMNIGWDSPKTITSEEQEIAGEVANQIGIAIEQARLLKETKLYNSNLEENIRLRTYQLEAKTKELETFSYSVAHDLKAPLRGIDGYSRLLLEDYNERLDEEGRIFINNIRKSTERMNQLIEDLLSYSRLERRPTHEYSHNLRALAQTAALGFEDEIQRRSGVVKMNVPDIVVTVDREGVTLALRNLLDNALKYTPLSQRPEIEISGEKGEKTVLLWIRDNGIGFDMKYHDRIFGIFNRLHHSEDYPGTGIGLAMVRKALERTGGRVWAESQPKKGAVFYIEIPLNESHTNLKQNRS